MTRIKRIGSLSYQFLSIPSIITRRNITWLCHFTSRQNIESIKQNGLLPRNLLPQGALTTDQYRADRSNAICLSISKPNKWMFEMKQNQGMDLCLILINPAVLYEKNCFFYPHNAATKSFRDVPSVMFQGNNALEALFAPEVTYQKAQKEQQSIYRHSFLSDCETTSDQAEVQCLEKIEPHYILHIFDENIPLDFATIKAYMASKEINENKAQGGRLNKSQNQSSAWRLNATQNETESEKLKRIEEYLKILREESRSEKVNQGSRSTGSKSINTSKHDKNRNEINEWRSHSSHRDDPEDCLCIMALIFLGFVWFLFF